MPSDGSSAPNWGLVLVRIVAGGILLTAGVSKLEKGVTEALVTSTQPAFAAAPSGPLAWKTLPCWYLLGTQDKAIPPALQRFMAERANATIVEVPASHVSFVSQPEAATQLTVQAVEATAEVG